MRTKTVCIIIIAVLVAGGSFFRFWRLNDRPMHTDEAVHAIKMGTLLEEGAYIYNPDEYHGPTLVYSTLLSAAIRGEKTYEQLQESTLRAIPALYGVLLCLTPLFYLRDMEKRAILFCVALLAFSPAFTYYSRYYIMEILLVFYVACFLGCFWNWLKNGGIWWAVFAGVSLGLMHATKETFVFAIVALVPAVVYYYLWEVKGESGKKRSSSIVAMLLTAAVVSVIFFSSFGSNPHGIIDSITTYSNWAARAGDHSIHSHPWYYYLDLIIYLEFFEPLSWNEDVIPAFAFLGLFAAFKYRVESRYRLIRFMSIFTCALLFIYSAIAYKTPWCLLSFLYGMVLIAGVMIDEFIEFTSGWLSRLVVCLLVLIFAFVSPIYQSWQLNFKYYADQTNPYVYAHTCNDVYSMVNAVDRAAAAEGKDTASVCVVSDDCNYWPFPWYLRGLDKVGYWNTIDDSICNASIILARADHEKAILNTLYTVPPAGQRHLYVPLFDSKLGLRPAVEWRGYIRKDLWDKMQAEKNKNEVSVENKEEKIELKPEVSKDAIPYLMKFSHVAMNTNFQVFIQDQRGNYSGRAARAAFNEIDRLESQLSRFVDNSDVSRINKLAPGEFELVDVDTMKCLQTAMEARDLTGGAFDITLGKVFTAWKNGEPEKAKQLYKARQSGEVIELDPESYVVKVLKDGVSVDLGGIGKGYAIDKIAKVLDEWGIKKALIHGGSSSVRALESPEGMAGWPVSLSDPVTNETAYRLDLANEVLSCSGLRYGKHIINPADGEPVTDKIMCWIKLDSNAALADALSTGVMIMENDAIRDLAENISGMSVIIYPADSEQTKPIEIGKW